VFNFPRSIELARIDDRIIKLGVRVQFYGVIWVHLGVVLPLGSKDHQSIRSIRECFRPSEARVAIGHQQLNYQPIT
jgi:hypothetical protein